MKSAVIQRLLSALALLAWAGVLLYFHFSGRLTKYLAPDFRTYVLAGGIGLAVVGLIVMGTAWRQAGCGHDHSHDDDGHDHDHEHAADIHPAVAFLILVLPVVLCTAWSQDRFTGEASLARKGAFDNPSTSSTGFLSANQSPLTSERIARLHPGNGAGFHEFTLTELFFALGNDQIRPLLENMPVETQGRMVIDRDGPPNQRRLYRLYITCCAADSQAIPILLRFPEGRAIPAISENAWVKVEGSMNYPDEGAGPLPVLHVASVRESPPPAEESFMRGGVK